MDGDLGILDLILGELHVSSQFSHGDTERGETTSEVSHHFSCKSLHRSHVHNLERETERVEGEREGGREGWRGWEKRQYNQQKGTQRVKSGKWKINQKKKTFSHVMNLEFVSLDDSILNVVLDLSEDSEHGDVGLAGSGRGRDEKVLTSTVGHVKHD